MEQIVVLGLGRLGLPFATTLARNKGVEVVGVDVREGLIAALRKGTSTLDEPNMDLSRVHAFTTDLHEALEGASAACIVVNTPPGPDGRLDHGDVARALGALVRHKTAAAPGFFVVLVSTMEPGPLRELGRKADEAGVPLVYHPQWIALGRVVQDLLHPPMALYGIRAFGTCPEEIARIERWWDNAARPAVELPYASAAIAKIALNAYLTQQIAFGGVLHHLVKAFGESPVGVVDALVCDRRFNQAYMKGAMPFGGPCFPKDLKSFMGLVQDMGFPTTLQKAVLETNESLAQRIAWDIAGLGATRIGLVGVAYKPGTSVVEGTHAVAIREVVERYRGQTVRWWDPLVEEFAPLGPKTLKADLLGWANCLVLLHGSLYGSEPPAGAHLYDPWS